LLKKDYKEVAQQSFGGFASLSPKGSAAFAPPKIGGVSEGRGGFAPPNIGGCPKDGAVSAPSASLTQNTVLKHSCWCSFFINK